MRTLRAGLRLDLYGGPVSAVAYQGSFMKLSIFSAIFAATCVVSSAAAIYSNGVPDTSQPVSRGIFIHRTADDFTLGAGAQIDSVRFWMAAEPNQFGGSITYAFYQNSAGALGTQIATGTVSNLSPTLLNTIPSTIYDYFTVDFTLLTPLQLAAGTYWLEIHDGSSLTANEDNNIHWGVVANAVGGNALQSGIPTLPSGFTGNELAFTLNGTLGTVASVPEPSTLSVVLGGLAALGMLRLRSRR